MLPLDVAAPAQYQARQMPVQMDAQPADSVLAVTGSLMQNLAAAGVAVMAWALLRAGRPAVASGPRSHGGCSAVQHAVACLPVGHLGYGGLDCRWKACTPAVSLSQQRKWQ